MSFDREEALGKMRLFTKVANPTLTSARPGPGMDQMGQGMAPWAIKQQPVTAATTRSLLNADLVKTRAQKSTTSMKRNQGSVLASAERQKPKQIRGGFTGNTEQQLIKEDKVIISSVVDSAARTALKRKLSELLAATKGGKSAATNTTVGYAKEKKKEAAMRKEAILPALARGWQVARGIGARLFGAGSGGAAARGAQLELPFAGAASRAAPAAEGALGYSNLPGYAHVVSAGKGTALPGAFHKAREVAQKAPGYLFGKGSGFKNVYKTKDTGKVFSSYRPRTFRPKNWEVVKPYYQTGGVVNQAAKGMLGGAAKGGLGAYGLSWALNREAAWDDPKRLNMALGGAVLFPSMFQGGPAALGTMAAMATSDKVRGAAAGFVPSVGALRESQKRVNEKTEGMSLTKGLASSMNPEKNSDRQRKHRAWARKQNAAAVKWEKANPNWKTRGGERAARAQAKQDEAIK